jgi:hypothetical protein
VCDRHNLAIDKSKELVLQSTESRDRNNYGIQNFAIATAGIKKYKKHSTPNSHKQSAEEYFYSSFYQYAPLSGPREDDFIQISTQWTQATRM